MTALDRGFLLLTSHLGDPGRKVLTVAQFRELTRRARQMEKPTELRDLTEEDLMAIGCDRSFSGRVLELFGGEEQLDWYLEQSQKQGCFPITRVNELYPPRVRTCLDTEAPGCLWAKGDLSLLSMPVIGLVGSRELNPENAAFAEEVGKQAALQGYALVSGNARGADRTAQESCLAHGGSVICVVADELHKAPAEPKLLSLSEDGFDLRFSSIRALSRNRIIHSLAEKVFVAQCTFGRGGTWDGATRNLKHSWSSVCCFEDGSAASKELIQRGAAAVTLHDLSQLQALGPTPVTLF